MLFKVIDNEPVYISAQYVELVQKETVQGVELTAVYIDGINQPVYIKDTIEYILGYVNHSEEDH